MKTLLRYLSIVTLVVVIVGAALQFRPIGERPLTALFPLGDVDVETVGFAELKLPEEPNRFLVRAPRCGGAKPHADSPMFDVSVDGLRARWPRGWTVIGGIGPTAT